MFCLQENRFFFVRMILIGYQIHFNRGNKNLKNSQSKNVLINGDLCIAKTRSVQLIPMTTDRILEFELNRGLGNYRFIISAVEQLVCDARIFHIQECRFSFTFSFE